MIIFVITGSRGFGFDRLVEAIDKVDYSALGADAADCFAQIGSSTYKPERVESTDFLSRNEFDKRITAADLVITHGGTGAIIGAVKKGKKVIAVPRRLEYHEAVDDHQVELVRQFESMGIIKGCFDLSHLEADIVEAISTDYLPYVSGSGAILDTIEDYIRNLEAENGRSV